MEREPGAGSGSLGSEFDRISHDPRIRGGKPITRVMRVTVALTVRQIGAEATIEAVVELGDQFP